MTDTPASNPPEWESYAFLQALLDSIEDPIFAKDSQHRWVACNAAFRALLGISREATVGHSDCEYMPREIYEVFWQVDDAVLTSGEPSKNVEQLLEADGSMHTIWTRKYPLRDADGTTIGLSAIITDITELKRRQDEVARLQAELAAKEAALAQQAAELQEKTSIIMSQGMLLEELAVPVLQIWEGVLLVPLVGALDSQRSARVMESLLNAIVRAHAAVVLLDITGVPVIDTQVAGHLIRAIQATQLLGCQSIVVGVHPEIAQTMVGLGLDFSQIMTRATLQSGLAYALKRLRYTVSYDSAQNGHAREFAALSLNSH